MSCAQCVQIIMRGTLGSKPHVPTVPTQPTGTRQVNHGACGRAQASRSGRCAATIRRKPSRHGTVVCPTSSCIRVRSRQTLASDCSLGALRASTPVSSPDVSAPLLDAHSLVAAPVDDRRRHRRHLEQLGTIATMSSEWIGWNCSAHPLYGDLLAGLASSRVGTSASRPVAVRHVEPRDRRRQVPPLGAVTRGGLGADLGDRVRRQVVVAVAVAERRVLSRMRCGRRAGRRRSLLQCRKARASAYRSISNAVPPTLPSRSTPHFWLFTTAKCRT